MINLLKQYANKRFDLFKMIAIEKVSISAGNITFAVLAFFAVIFFIIMLNIGLGLLIGHFLGNYGYGMLIMAGFYLLILIILFLARKAIGMMVANKIIKAINK